MIGRFTKWLGRKAESQPNESVESIGDKLAQMTPKPMPNGKFWESTFDPFNYQRWASDPDFAKKRAKVKKRIIESLDSLLLPKGYTREKQTWSKKICGNTAIISLQSSRTGHAIWINLSTIGITGSAKKGIDHFGADKVRLGNFISRMESGHAEPATLYYGLIHEGDDLLDQALNVLETRALPWLEAFSATPNLKTIAASLGSSPSFSYPRIKDFIPAEFLES